MLNINPADVLKGGHPVTFYDEEHEVLWTYIEIGLASAQEVDAEFRELVELAVYGSQWEIPGIDPTVTGVDVIALESRDPERGVSIDIRCTIEVASDRLQEPDFWGMMCYQSDGLEAALALPC